MCYPRYVTSIFLCCTFTENTVKQWDAHLLTKQHRTSVSREKASGSQSKTKRPADSDGGETSKRARTGPAEEVVRSSILPAGFFSGGSGPTIVGAEEEDEDDEQEEQQQKGKSAAGPSSTKASAPVPKVPTSTTKPSAAPAAQTGDEELDSFLASLAEPDPEPTATPAAPAPAAPTAATQKASGRNTSTYREILPGQASYEAAPVRNLPKDQEQAEQAEPEVQESEAEKRARLAREEREEIMDRLEEEERAQ